MPGSAPIELRVYPGGHMFYFDDGSRAALHDDVRAALHGDAKAVFDPVDATGGSR
jgi:carboxypeptidase C (cathepsin A)